MGPTRSVARQLLESFASKRREIRTERAVHQGLRLDAMRLVESFEKLDDVGQVPVTARPQLEIEQPGKGDDVGIARAAGQSLGRWVRARSQPREGAAGDEKIDAHPRFRMAQASRAQALEPMRAESGFEALGCAALDEHVHVFREARIAVMNQGDPADDLERDARIPEELADRVEGAIDGR